MPEFIRTAEVVGNVLEKAYHAGKFVVDRLTGGAWADLPHGEPRPARPPVRAHIEYLRTGEPDEPQS